VTTPTWNDHLYSCQYIYPNGTLTVSVKELSSRAETTAYFAALRTQFGVSEQLNEVAQGAFVTQDGSLVLRKDYKVLFVDTSTLTTPFGSGFKNHSQVAVGVGITVLGCWTGA
jgi:TorA maturation chaperone TorD